MLFCLVSGGANPRVLKGSLGYLVEEAGRTDERDTVFARNRSLPLGSEAYKKYYKHHPQKEERDAERRLKGVPLGKAGAIDGGYRPNIAMMESAFQTPEMLGSYAEPEPFSGEPPANLTPDKATRIVKGWAKHIGADLVGVCRVNELWAYSHRGEIHFDNWEDWGKAISDRLPYAVVMATEMDYAVVGGGPHTPCVVESAANYAKGTFITTILVQWFCTDGISI